MPILRGFWRYDRKLAKFGHNQLRRFLPVDPQRIYLGGHSTGGDFGDAGG
jgi:hypothetical protein